MVRRAFTHRPDGIVVLFLFCCGLERAAYQSPTERSCQGFAAVPSVALTERGLSAQDGAARRLPKRT
jgi:hypothetical protein